MHINDDSLHKNYRNANATDENKDNKLPSTTKKYNDVENIIKNLIESKKNDKILKETQKNGIGVKNELELEQTDLVNAITYEKLN